MAKAKKRKAPVRFNPTEAISAFSVFLMSREAPIVFSNKHQYGPIVELMQAFKEANNWPKLREDGPIANHPEHLNHLSNMVVENQVAKRLQVNEALQIVQNLFRNLGQRDQLVLFSQIVEGQRRDAADQLQSAEDEEKKRLRSLQTATQHFRDVQRIINGDLVLMV